MHRASDEVAHADHLESLAAAAETLDLSEQAEATARELFLTDVPDEDRSKPVAIAASLYAGARIAGEARSQSAVADAVDVSRIAVQRRWRDRLAVAGLDAPSW